ncbi:MAG: hypothetical protein ABI543_06900 [Ignavibacteria bacterium]
MKSKEKAETRQYDNLDNLELDLMMFENELYSWLISSAYQNYSPEIIKKKIKKSTNNNKSKRTNNKKTKRSLK